MENIGTGFLRFHLVKIWKGPPGGTYPMGCWGGPYAS